VGWGAGRQFAVDMAGFAINLRFLLARPAAEFAQEVKIQFIFFLFSFVLVYIQHCFICRPSDSTVPTDAGIEPRTVATSALAVRRSNH
jgi:hypothetical protein